MENVWIWNHYATRSYQESAGRHYWQAKELIKKGYKVTIFCASTRHNSEENIEITNKKYVVKSKDEISFVFIKTPSYSNNGIKRVWNMFSFYKNISLVAKEYGRSHGKPDRILASSVHPLTLVAGIKTSKYFNINSISEVRDLWPESLIAYNVIGKNNLLAKILYRGEKWIYKNSDSIIMTWPGGKDYIVDQGWNNEIDLNKVTYISNGVLINEFDKNSEEYQIHDEDLEDSRYKNIVYTGSIRKVNNLNMLIDVAKLLQEQNYNDFRFLIFGSGDELDKLVKRCKEEKIDNIIFKGKVEKKYIPYILKNAYLNILHNTSTTLDKYGQSQNKLFEYLAAGRCVIQTYDTEYSIIKKYNCGMSASKQNADEIANLLIKIYYNEKKCEEMGKNARVASYDFDFEILTKKLISVIENVETVEK